MIGFKLNQYRRFDDRHAAVVGVWEESDKKRVLDPYFKIQISYLARQLLLRSKH